MRKAIFSLAILLLLTGSAFAQSTSWEYNITVNAIDHSAFMNITMGMTAGATDGYDGAGLDIIAPPPMPSGFRAYFVAPSTDGFDSLMNPFLIKDTRNNTPDIYEWVVRTEYAVIPGGDIEWIIGDIPDSLHGGNIERAFIGTRAIGSTDEPTDWVDMFVDNSITYHVLEEAVIRITTIGAVDHLPPVVSNLFPPDGAVGVRETEVIKFTITDDVSGVDLANTSVELEIDLDKDGLADSLADITTAGVFIPTIGGYNFEYVPIIDYPTESEICVLVNSIDLCDTPFVMPEVKWCFQIAAIPEADTIPPVYNSWSIGPVGIDTLANPFEHIALRIEDFGVGVNAATIHVYLDGTTMIPDDMVQKTALGVAHMTYDVDIPPYPPTGWDPAGSHTIRVEACDLAGNCSASLEREFLALAVGNVWQMLVTIEDGSGSTSDLTFGQHPTASDLFDPDNDFPQFDIPGFYGYFPISDPSYFMYTMLSKDIRKFDYGSMTWDVEVHDVTGPVVTVSWDRTLIPELPDPLRLRLFLGYGTSPDAMTWVNLKSHPTEFVDIPVGDIIKLQAIVADSSSMDPNPHIQIIKPLSGEYEVSVFTDIEFILTDDIGIDRDSVYVLFDGVNVTSSLDWTVLPNGYRIVYNPGVLDRFTEYEIYVHAEDLDPTRHYLNVSWPFTTGDTACGPVFDLHIKVIDPGIDSSDVIIGVNSDHTIAYDAFDTLDKPLPPPIGFSPYIYNPDAPPFVKWISDFRNNCVRNEWLIRFQDQTALEQIIRWDPTVIFEDEYWCLQIAVAPIAGPPPDDSDYVNMRDVGNISIVIGEQAHVRYGTFCGRNKYYVSGNVYSALDSHPIEGAKIWMAGFRDTTDASGFYKVGKIFPGVTNLEVEADDYIDTTISVTIIDHDVVVDVYLELPTFSISGTTYVDGAATGGVDITVVGIGEFSSHPSGYFEIGNLLAGSYELIASYGVGYNADTNDVTIVDADETVNFHINQILYTVTCEVLDSRTGDPIVGADVDISNPTYGTLSDVTGTDGKCSFDRPMERYDIDVSYTGYDPASETIILSGDTTVTFRITPSKVTVTVNATLEGRTDYSGITIRMTGELPTITPTSGRVVYTDVEWGNYTVSAEKEYFATKDTTFPVMSSRSIDLMLPYYWPVNRFYSSFTPRSRPLSGPISLTICWRKPSSAYLNVDKYELYDGGGTRIHTSSSATDTCYTITSDIHDGGSYSYYVITKYTDGGTSVPSSIYTVDVHVEPDRNRVLIIDFDGGEGFTELFTQVLNNIGVDTSEYTITDQDEDITVNDKYNLDDYSGILDGSGVFVVFGTRATDSNFPIGMRAAVVDYIEHGGFIFIQGPDFAQDYSGTELLNLFNFTGTDGSRMATGNVQKVESFERFFGAGTIHWRGNYPYQTAADDYVDFLDPGTGTQKIYYANGDTLSIVGVMYGRAVYTSVYLASVTSPSWDIAGCLIGAILDLNAIENTEVKEIPASVPTAFILNICPNPFNSTTDISFDIPEANNVELTVYDITGIRVAELYKGSMTAGHHVINWNADGLQSGLYMVTLSYDGYTISSRAFYVK